MAGLACAAAAAWWGWPKVFPASHGTAEAGGGASPLYRGGIDRRGRQPGFEDPTTGGRIWACTAQDAQAMYGAPAVCGKYVYTATVNYLPLSDRGAIVCLDAATGQEVWRDSLGDLRSVFSSSAVSGEYVVCGEGLHHIKDARIVCLERRTGRKVWTFRTQEHVESSPCVYEGKVYIGAGADGYYCLKLEGDGAGEPVVLWHKTVADGFIDCESSPVAHEGKVYVGSAQDGLLCIGAPGKPPEPVWSGHLGGPGKSGRCDEVPIAQAYAVAWSYPKDGPAPPFQLSAPPAYLDGTLFLPVQDEKRSALLLVTVDPAAPGHEPVIKGAVACALPIVVSPAVRRGSVYFVEGRSGDAERRLRAVDVKTGAELWTCTVEKGAGGAFALAGGMLLAASLEHGVAAYGLDGADAGKLLWKNSLGPAAGMPMAADGRAIVALKHPPRLAVLDRESGATLWTQELAAEPTCGPVLLDETICVGTAAGVQAYALLDGAPRWSQPEAGSIAAPLAATGSLLAAVNGAGRVNLLDAQTGKLLKSIGGAPAGLSAQLGKEALFYFGAQVS